MNKLFSRLFLILLAVGVVAALIYSFLPQPILVDLASIDRGSLQVTVDEDGKTRIRERYIVSAPLAGRLLRIDMDPGDQVVASDTLLATIKPRDPELLDARSIAQAEARVKGAESMILKTSTGLRRSTANQEDAERDLARVRSLREKGAATISELEDAELLLHIRGEELRSARYAEEIAKFELAQAEAALIRSRPLPANAQGESDNPPTFEGNGEWNFQIHSPISGRVLRVMQESSAVVNAGTPLLELGDPTDLEVEIDVLSSDAVKIEPGAICWLDHWGGDKSLQGRVQLVEPAAFTKISTLGVEEQRVNIIVDLVDPPEERANLGDGFRVEARIVITELDEVLKVPTSSLFRVDGKWAVFVVLEGKVRQQMIEVGSQNGLEAEVTAGLEEGDSVVAHPSDRIEDGVMVEQR